MLTTLHQARKTQIQTKNEYALLFKVAKETANCSNEVCGLVWFYGYCGTKEICSQHHHQQHHQQITTAITIEALINMDKSRPDNLFKLYGNTAADTDAYMRVMQSKTPYISYLSL